MQPNGGFTKKLITIENIMHSFDSQIAIILKYCLQEFKLSKSFVKTCEVLKYFLQSLLIHEVSAIICRERRKGENGAGRGSLRDQSAEAHPGITKIQSNICKLNLRSQLSEFCSLFKFFPVITKIQSIICKIFRYLRSQLSGFCFLCNFCKDHKNTVHYFQNIT